MGDANDYVGKGLSGATIIIRPSPEFGAAEPEQYNCRQYLFVRCDRPASCSQRAKRASAFAVRNSGALAVIEGCGSNACEYMTGGEVVVLGDVGDNFGAGFTGGMAFVYDPNGRFHVAA